MWIMTGLQRGHRCLHEYPQNKTMSPIESKLKPAFLFHFNLHLLLSLSMLREYKLTIQSVKQNFHSLQKLITHAIVKFSKSSAKLKNQVAKYS